MRIPARPPNVSATLHAHARELDEVLIDEKFQNFIIDCQRRYRHWDKVRIIAPRTVNTDLAWAMIKLNRMQRYRRLPLTGHADQQLRYTIPDQVQQELMYIDQQLAGNLAGDDDNPLTPQQKERFILTALREEAIASSMLEGAVTTWRDAKDMLKTGRRPRTKGEQMVLNNYLAIQFVRDHLDVDLSPAFLLELQSILTRETLDRGDGVGRFRNERDDVQVVDDRDNAVIHTPPPAAELDERIEALCTFANREHVGEEFIHPVVQACIIHFQIGLDHPFCDGNGRTARTLFYWLMLRRGYWLFEYLPISRLIYNGPSKYVRAYLKCETDDFDVTYFLLYKARIIQRARKELRQFIRNKQQQMTRARKLFSSDRRLNHRQREVLLRAARNPDAVFTIAQHKSQHAIAYGTARSDLLELAEWGYLSHEQTGNRYEFRPVKKLPAAGPSGS